MKKVSKIFIICSLVLLIFAIIIVSNLRKNMTYRDDYTALGLFVTVSNSFINEGGFNMLEDDIILEFVDKKPSYLKDYAVIKAKNAKNINEVGIFKTEYGKMDEMKMIVEEYVNKLQQSYRTMDYFPEEKAKYENATVKIYGCYVIYSFLNEKDSSSFYKAIEITLLNNEKALSNDNALIYYFARILFKYIPVKLSGTLDTSSGVPCATIVPPPSPPSGPKSIR